MLQNVVLDSGGVLSADPVLGGGPHKALSRVLILDSTGVTPQSAVDVTQGHQHITVVSL